MDLPSLKQRLEELSKKNNETWYNSLTLRKKDEAEHHNQQRDKNLTQNLAQDTYELLHGNKKFYSTIEKSEKYLTNWLREKVPGKIVLDFACGNGNQVIKAAKLGAEFSIGIDISDISIENAKKAAEKEGVAHKCFFLRGDCENTQLPSNAIDIVLCTGVLHHMDLSYAFPEIRRILKPGGCSLAVEALNYNPIIKLYRRLTPSMRTEWEKNHILSLRDVSFAEKFFKIKEVRFWHLTSIPLAYLRKWNWLFEPLLKVANLLDTLILKIPGVKLLSWQFTFEMHKGEAF